MALTSLLLLIFLRVEPERAGHVAHDSVRGVPHHELGAVGHPGVVVASDIVAQCAFKHRILCFHWELISYKTEGRKNVSLVIKKYVKYFRFKKAGKYVNT